MKLDEYKARMNADAAACAAFAKQEWRFAIGFSLMGVVMIAAAIMFLFGRSLACVPMAVYGIVHFYMAWDALRDRRYSFKIRQEILDKKTRVVRSLEGRL